MNKVTRMVQHHYDHDYATEQIDRIEPLKSPDGLRDVGARAVWLHPGISLGPIFAAERIPDVKKDVC